MTFGTAGLVLLEGQCDAGTKISARGVVPDGDVDLLRRLPQDHLSHQSIASSHRAALGDRHVQ